MSPAEHISDFVVRQSTKELHSAVQVVLLNQSLQLAHSLAIAANDEVDVLELS